MNTELEEVGYGGVGLRAMPLHNNARRAKCVQPSYNRVMWPLP